MVLAEVLFLAAVTGFASAEIPPYIHVCGARNPNLNQCIANSIIDLLPMLRKGIPELDIPSSEPFKLAELTIIDMPNLQLTGKNIEISGISYFKLNSLNVDMKNRVIEMDVTFDDIKLNADYDIMAKILVDIKEQGPISLETKNTQAIVRLTHDLIDRNGKQYVWFTSMTTKLDIKHLDIHFEAPHLDKTLREAIHQALGSSQREIIETNKPNIEKGISRTVIDMANKICKHFSYDELFPDRE